MNTFALIAKILNNANYSVPIYPNKIPQTSPTTGGLFPCIVFHDITSSPQNTKSTAVEVDEIRFQLDFYSLTYTEAKSVSQSVRNYLENYPYKQSASSTILSVVIQQIFFLGQQDANIVDDAAQPAYEGLYGQTQDYLIRVQN